MISISKIVFCM